MTSGATVVIWPSFPMFTALILGLGSFYSGHLFKYFIKIYKLFYFKEQLIVINHEYKFLKFNNLFIIFKQKSINWRYDDK